MISLIQFQEIIANSFFDGSVEMAGMLLYACVLAVILVIFKNSLFAGLLINIPLTLLFMRMNVLTGDLPVILIVITVLGLATVTATKGVLGGDR